MQYNFRGKYDSSQNYNKLDVVVYQATPTSPKRFYLCLTSHTSANPQPPVDNQDTVYWGVLNSDSNFPNSIDDFITRTTMTASDKADYDRYTELFLKTSLTPAEQDEMSTLLNKLRNKILQPEDFNKLQSALQNMQFFLKNEVEGYISQKQAEFQGEIDKFTFKGTYSPTTTYNKKNIVEYNGESYICLIDGTINIPPTNTTNWAKIAARGAQGIQGLKGDDGINFVFKGQYDPTYTYSPNDAVQYEGSLYYCKQTSAGNAPTNTTYWDLAVARGASILLTTLKNEVILSVDSANIPIGIPQFNANQDVLFVFKNSVYMHQDTDWRINPNLTSIDVIGGSWVAGTEVNFVVLKNMQQSLIYTDGTMLQDNSVSDAKLMPDNKVGSLSALNTTNKSSAVAAINEVDNKIGNLSNLNTTDKTSVVNAVNEVKQQLALHSAETASKFTNLNLNIIDMAVELETLKGATLNGVTANIFIETFNNLNDINLMNGVYDSTNKRLVL